MNPIEIMHALYGECPVNHTGNPCRCGDCHFFHWKIEGKGENRRQVYRWCEIYGLNKANLNETDWKWEYRACRQYNRCENPKEKNLYRKVNEIEKNISDNVYTGVDES